MNALDQAFIKAFAKDRTTTASGRTSSAPTVTVQPPEKGVESVALVLHELYEQGRRLRIDRPLGSDPQGLIAHVVFPTVERTESYQAEDLLRLTPAHMIVEDRLSPLDDSGDQNQLDPHDAPRPDEAASMQLGANSPAQPIAGAMVDRGSSDHTPVTAHGAAEGQRVGPTDVEPADVETRLVLWAARDVTSLNLGSEEFGCLAVLDAATLADTAIALDVGTLDIDPRLLEPPVDGPVVRDSQVDARCDAPAAGRASDLPLVTLETQRHVESSSAPSPEVTAGEADVAPSSMDELVSDPRPDAPQLEDFRPAWEVDAFRWPELCGQLDEASGGKLKQSGDELGVATHDGLKVLAVTGTNRQEGRTTLALSLARSAAQSGCRVALLDGDCANPQLASLLGLEAPCDWYESARLCQPLNEAAIASLTDQLTLFPLAVSNEGVNNSLEDEVLRYALAELRRAFDLIVVDMPPVTSGQSRPQYRADTCPVDMAVVVRNVNATSPSDTLGSVACLRSAGVRAVGIVENFAPGGGSGATS